MRVPVGQIAGIGDHLAMLAQFLLEEHADEIAHRDAVISVVLDVDLSVDRPYRIFLNYLRRTIAEIHIRAQAAEIKDEVGLVHSSDDWPWADGADMNTHMQRMVHRECTL